MREEIAMGKKGEMSRVMRKNGEERGLVEGEGRIRHKKNKEK